MTSQRCARPGCSRKVKGDQLACRDDWFLLPPELRDKIWRTYRAMKKRPSPETMGAHLRLVGEAMQTWEAAE